MGLEEKLRVAIGSVLDELVRSSALPADVLAASYTVERPKRADLGDLATNVALAASKLAKKAPRDLAALLSERLAAQPGVVGVDVAGPGFLNVRVAPEWFHGVLAEVAALGAGYGRAPAGTGERVLVEFVSANPTGPLLVSHARNAIAGDAISRLLEAAGARVTREYYVNDFGNQVRLLAASVRAAAKGEPPPEDGYGGAYVKELASYLVATGQLAACGDDEARVARLCVRSMLDGVPGSRELPGIRRTLREIGVAHDAWFSEEGLHRWGRVESSLDELRVSGWLDEREGALFFRSAQAEGGDDKDRVVRKSDGTYTYFASDIAYHADKIARGYDRLVNVLGADHHGYVARVRNALEALGLPKERFEVVLYQLVSLLRDGQPVKMGKRLGNLITIEEVVEEIDQAAGRKGAGADALRYFFLVRTTDTPVKLDLEIAKKASLENPVFYLQYGHARLSSILARAEERLGAKPPRPTPALLAKLVHPDELDLLARLGAYPRIVREAAAERAPHKVLHYLTDLAQAFQSYYTRLRAERDPILPPGVEPAAAWPEGWDRAKTEARLAWVAAIRTVYAAGLGLLGISAPDRMDRPAGELTPEDDEDDAGAKAAAHP